MNKALIDDVAEAIRGDCPPWRVTEIPTNAFTNRRYGGMSYLILSIEMMRRKISSKWWATYKQWVWLRCKIKARPDDVPEGAWGVKLIRYEEKNERKVAKPFVLFSGTQVYGADAAKWKSAFTTADNPEYNQGVREALKVQATANPAFDALVREISRCQIESEFSVPHDPDMAEYRKYQSEWMGRVYQDDFLLRAVKTAEQLVDAVTKRNDKREGE